MLRKILRTLLIPGLMLLISVLLVRGAQMRDASFAAMKLSASVVIPTLFPFSVLSGFLLRTGILQTQDGRSFHLFYRITGIEHSIVPAWLLGTLCGFPIGASVLSGLCEGGSVSRSSAERMAPCCSNASPAFVVLIAGQTVLGASAYGWMLLAIHTASSLLTARILRTSSPKSGSFPRIPAVPAKPMEALIGAVQAAALTMLQISGYIVLFSSASVLLTSMLPDNGILSPMLRGILELTGGLYALSPLPLPVRFLLSAGLLGWSGFCVHFQVLSLLRPHGLSSRPYFWGKLLQAALSILLSLPILPLLPQDVVPAASIKSFSGTSFLLTAAWALFTSALFFTFLWKSRLCSAIIKKSPPEG